MSVEGGQAQPKETVAGAYDDCADRVMSLADLLSSTMTVEPEVLKLIHAAVVGLRGIGRVAEARDGGMAEIRIPRELAQDVARVLRDQESEIEDEDRQMAAQMTVEGILDFLDEVEA